MIATRFRQIALLLLAVAISALAFIQMFQRTTGAFPVQYAIMLCAAAALFLVFCGLTARFQPDASQSIMPCVLLLTATGITMIARIDQSEGWDIAKRQIIWLYVALVLSTLIIVFLRDYRVLRRFSYVSMVVGLILLLSPMLPVIGTEINGARIWVRIPGLGSFQPGEFAKLFLAFFFAAYLFDHRDQLAVGGKKVLGLQLPRIKDLGPIIVVWIASMGVLIVQHDAVHVHRPQKLDRHRSDHLCRRCDAGRKHVQPCGFESRCMAAPVQQRTVHQVPRRLLAAGHRHFRPGIRRHDRYRSGPGTSISGHLRQLRFHLRLPRRGARPGGRHGYSDALPDHHRFRLHRRYENQGRFRQAACFRTGVHHGFPGIHRGRRHHARHSAYRPDPAIYGSRRFQSYRQLHSCGVAYRHFQFGEPAGA